MNTTAEQHARAQADAEHATTQADRVADAEKRAETQAAFVTQIQDELAAVQAARQAANEEVKRRLHDDATGGLAYSEQEHAADRAKINAVELRIERLNTRLAVAKQAQVEADKAAKLENYRFALAAAGAALDAHNQLVEALRKQADELANTIESILKARNVFHDARKKASGACWRIHYRRENLSKDESRAQNHPLPVDGKLGVYYRTLSVETGEQVDHSMIPSQIDQRLHDDKCPSLGFIPSGIKSVEMERLKRTMEVFLKAI